MPAYMNTNHNSGVVEYEIGPDSITITFADGSVYLYDAVKPGLQEVRILARLAVQGSGLNGYINSRIRDNFARKIR